MILRSRWGAKDIPALRGVNKAIAFTFVGRASKDTKALNWQWTAANAFNSTIIKPIPKVQNAKFEHAPNVMRKESLPVPLPARVLQACPSTLTRLRAPCGVK